MENTNPKVDWYFNKPSKWHNEYVLLRNIVLDCGLTEELKWGVPCYTYQKKNIVLIHGFKDYCALLFHKGALLNDSEGILIQQTKHVQSARQIRFTSEAEISGISAPLKSYIYEAIEVEKAGLEVKFKKRPEPLPEEFKHQLKKSPDLKKAFESLTPGRQRAYILYFSSAKQSKTRKARIEKYKQSILLGKGLNDD